MRLSRLRRNPAILIMCLVACTVLDFKEYEGQEDAEEISYHFKNFTHMDGSRLVEFKKLKKLTILLTPLCELPKEIGQLRELEHIHLAKTKVTKLPRDIGQPEDSSPSQ